MPITVCDIPANKFIEQYAQQLKREGKIAQPAWSVFVKTGRAQQYSPENADWFYVRSAAIMRRLYCQGTNGMTDLRRMFGMAKDGTVVPRKFKLAGGAIITQICKQLKQQGLVEIVAGEGRKLTDKGKKALDAFASQLK
ncbi:Ribosomal_protein S19 [Hexamita inflata]|uniref:Ribosomal protein S19 n=1 Tax=Hexamita inflata TaxID=28002 RepID=A0AA86NQN2_9EUKA|nr:Ribosomal protein S19 [Hexamita inflata]CAI9938365.1 Ribosomal protein S19 [Hexamita inflata]CAI9947006.1 Ribosomal protein S19 [Hexamita inflata]